MKLDSVITGERRGAVYTGDASLRTAVTQCFERNTTGALGGLHFYFEGESDVQCRVLRWNLRDCGMWTIQDSEVETAKVIATGDQVLNMDEDYLKPAYVLVQKTVRHGALMRWWASLTEINVDVDLLMARLQQTGRAALVAGTLKGVAVLHEGATKIEIVQGEKVEAQKLLNALNAWVVMNSPHLLAKVEIYMA